MNSNNKKMYIFLPKIVKNDIIYLPASPEAYELCSSYNQEFIKSGDVHILLDAHAEGQVAILEIER